MKITYDTKVIESIYAMNARFKDIQGIQEKLYSEDVKINIVSNILNENSFIFNRHIILAEVKGQESLFVIRGSALINTVLEFYNSEKFKELKSAERRLFEYRTDFTVHLVSLNNVDDIQTVLEQLL